MTRWVITLFAAAALVAAPAAISRSDLAPGVARGVSLPPGSARTLSVTCPAGSVAVSGGVKSAGDATTTLVSRPAGPRAFSFRVGNPAGNPPQRVSVAVACRAAGAGRHFKLTHVQTRPVSVPANAAKQVSLACPRATLAAGAGFDLVRGAKGATSPLELRRQTQTLSGFSFTVRNTGTNARSAVFYGICLTVSVGRIQVKLTTATTPVRPGSQVAAQRCPRGWFSLATGYVLPPPITLGGTVAVNGGGRWTLANSAASPALTRLQLSCARLSR